MPETTEGEAAPPVTPPVPPAAPEAPPVADPLPPEKAADLEPPAEVVVEAAPPVPPPTTKLGRTEKGTPGVIQLSISVPIDAYTADCLEGGEFKLTRSAYADLRQALGRATTAAFGAEYGDRVEGGV